MKTVDVRYQDGSVELQGFMAVPEGATSAPAVLIAHPWGGLNDFCRSKALQLAEEGFVAFALDMYGKGILASGPEDARALMMPFVDDRQMLRRRIQAAVDTVRQQVGVDPLRVGAIGYCFGGLCVLELARSGSAVQAVVSFHGMLHTPLPAEKDQVAAKVLVCHGWQDPMAPPSDVAAFGQEMDAANVSWELNVYGDAAHAFTNPQAESPETGMVFNANADRRSWRAMLEFFSDCL